MQAVFSSSTGKPLAPISGVDVPVVGSRPGDKITYLYRYGHIFSWVQADSPDSRVTKGLAHHSYAARCAELCGLPHGVVERAEHVG